MKQQRGLTWFWRAPPIRWLAEYRAGWLIGDVIAGLTLAAHARIVAIGTPATG